MPVDVELGAQIWAHPTTQAVRQAKSAVRAAGRIATVAGPMLAERASRPDDRWVVVTQTCDLIKDCSQLPQVEVALAITTDDARTIAQAGNFGSARYYLLGALGSRALILDWSWRTFLDRGFLVELAPDNAILEHWSEEQHKMLARWLGRRFGRPVLSEEDVREIVDPVRSAWVARAAVDPEAVARYSATFAEFRYRRELDGSLSIFILSVEPEPPEDLFLEVVDLLSGALEEIHGDVAVDPTRRSYHTFTKADELTTSQIDLEWASHEEEGATGAIPPS